MLKDAGSNDVIAEDRTDQVNESKVYIRFENGELLVLTEFFLFRIIQFMKVLRRELERVEKEKEEFISDFSKVSIFFFVSKKFI